jgi:hypothetical protein
MLLVSACCREAADGDGTKDIFVSENWLVLLFKELEKEGITLPERWPSTSLFDIHNTSSVPIYVTHTYFSVQL